METGIYISNSATDQGNSPCPVDDRNEAFKRLPEYVKMEIRKLGWSTETFTEHMLQAIEIACYVDGRLVDDPNASRYNLDDMMVQTWAEKISGEKKIKDGESHYWRGLIEKSQQSADGHSLTAA